MSSPDDFIFGIDPEAEEPTSIDEISADISRFKFEVRQRLKTIEFGVLLTALMAGLILCKLYF